MALTEAGGKRKAMARTIDKPSLEAVMEKAGVRFPHNRDKVTVHCPFHEDISTPNMSVDRRAGLFHCFACQAGGDVYDFVGMQEFGKEGWNNRDKEQFARVLELLDLKQIPVVPVREPRKAKTVGREIIQVLSFATQVYHYNLLSPMGKAARAYLEGRGITKETIHKFQIGYAGKGTLTAAIAAYPAELRQAALEAGLIVKDFDAGNQWEFFYNRVVFPDITRSGTVRHMVGRALGQGKKYLALPGLPKSIWNLANLTPRDPVIITESVMDAVTALQMQLPFAAVNGTGIAHYLLPQLRRSKHLGILPQNDAPAIEAVRLWKEKLPHARPMEIPWLDTEKDLNDIYMGRGESAARSILLEALSEIGFEFS
jgi:DNA primase